MNYHLKFLLLVVLRTLSWIIIIKTTVEKFTIRQIMSIITRNYFRKTWIISNKIHFWPVYSYLIEIFSVLRSRVNEITTQFHQSSQEQNFRVGYYHFCYPRTLTPLCFKVHYRSCMLSQLTITYAYDSALLLFLF